MEKNWIKIDTGKKILYANFYNGKIYSNHNQKHGVLCSCTGNTEETATQFDYDEKNKRIICPECGKEFPIVYDYSDYLKKEEERQQIALENLHLSYIGWSAETGMKFYTLSTRVEYETWNKIKHLFHYNTCNDDMLEGSMKGWVTSQPGEVEKILVNEGMIKPENTISAADEAYKKQVEEEKILNNKINEIKQEFIQEGEKPEGTHDPQGKTINHPFNPRNIYGGGEWFVINDVEIWYIVNNGFDGADWGLNNIKTGGAGAIGRRLPYSEKLEKKIREIMDG